MMILISLFHWHRVQKFFSTDAGFFGLAEACSIVIFLLNVIFIVYWLYVWWLHSEYRVKAAETGKVTIKATRKIVNKAATRTSTGLRSWHSRILELSRRSSINSNKEEMMKEKKKKKKRPSCLVTIEEMEMVNSEQELPRIGVSVNAIVKGHEVRNPLNDLDHKLHSMQPRAKQRSSLLADAVKRDDDHLSLEA